MVWDLRTGKLASDVLTEYSIDPHTFKLLTCVGQKIICEIDGEIKVAQF